MSGLSQAVDAPFLPYGRHSIEDDDIAAVSAVLRGESLTNGPQLARFEAALAECVRAPHARACSSGTAALHLAMLALGIGAGDAVVVPAVTFLATANAARFTGAEVVFADVDPLSGLMTPDTLAEALARPHEGRLRAVVPVHLAGQPADMPALAALARQHDIAVVEDACHALGSFYEDGEGLPHAVGACAHSDAAVFSFHPVKTVAMGEGGAITTQDAALAARIALLRNHGMTRTPEDFVSADLAFAADGTPNPWYYEMQALGHNYRASELHCALGASQLTKLGRFVAARRALVAAYDRLLAPLAPVVTPLGCRPGAIPAWHLYVMRVDFAALGLDRAAVMRTLAAQGIGSQVHYLPLHLQPYYRRLCGPLALRGAEAYYRGCLSLPLFPAMTEADVARAAAALGALVGMCVGA